MNAAGGKNPALHLKNAINYILKPQKTENGRFTGGLASMGAKKAYQQFIDTKKFFHKEDQRQGYHFVISFKEGEATPEMAYQITQEFVELYLKNNYDCVYAVHNDTKCVHSHIVFNSVNYDGYKYHYQKGDWKRFIQPITNQLCKKYHLSEMEFDEEMLIGGKAYNQWEADNIEEGFSWFKIIKWDIEQAISRSSTYEEFLDYLRENKYEVREGELKKHGKYLSLKPFGKPKAVRNFQLGEEFKLQEIISRIESNSLEEKVLLDRPDIRCIEKKMHTTLKKTPHVHKYRFRGNMRKVQKNPFELFYIKRFRTLFGHYQKYKPVAWKYKKDLLRIKELESQCRYIQSHHIDSKKKLKEERKNQETAIQSLNNEQKLAYRYYYKNQKEFKLLKELRELEQMNLATGKPGELERIQEIRSLIPADAIALKYQEYQETLDGIKVEKKTISKNMKLLSNIEMDLKKWRFEANKVDKQRKEEISPKNVRYINGLHK